MPYYIYIFLVLRMCHSCNYLRFFYFPHIPPKLIHSFFIYIYYSFYRFHQQKICTNLQLCQKMNFPTHFPQTPAACPLPHVCNTYLPQITWENDSLWSLESILGCLVEQLTMWRVKWIFTPFFCELPPTYRAKLKS